LFLILALASSMIVQADADARDRNIEYLGDGRYKCTSGDCDGFNARQDQINRQNQRYERDRREWEAERSRERTDRAVEQTRERRW
jgi:hypothetical protein